MLSIQTLTTIETLLMSKSAPQWGEFMTLAQVISEVQFAKQALTASRAQVQASLAQQVPDGAALQAAQLALS